MSGRAWPDSRGLPTSRPATLSLLCHDKRPLHPQVAMQLAAAFLAAPELEASGPRRCQLDRDDLAPGKLDLSNLVTLHFDTLALDLQILRGLEKGRHELMRYGPFVRQHQLDPLSCTYR